MQNDRKLIEKLQKLAPETVSLARQALLLESFTDFGYSEAQITFFALHGIKPHQVTNPDESGDCIIPNSEGIWANAPKGNIWLAKDGSAVIETKPSDRDPDHYLIFGIEPDAWCHRIDHTTTTHTWGQTAENIFSPKTQEVFTITEFFDHNNEEINFHITPEK